MIVLRPPNPSFINQVKEMSSFLLKTAIYKNGATLSEAPNYMDCMSMVAHLYNSYKTPNAQVPVYWIGNFPARLTQMWDFKVLSTDAPNPGDFVFVHGKNRKRLITHVLLAIDSDQFLHCEKEHGGYQVASWSDITIRYDQPFTEEELIENVDPRSNSYKKAHGLSLNVYD